MDIHRCGSRPSVVPSPQYFTGDVRQDPIVSAAAPSRVNAIVVTFVPAARTAWHSHPAGQTLFVTAGKGRVQVWGGEVTEIFAGDSITFAPGEKHWHGAAPDCGMVHIAMQESVDGRAADWLELVSDEQYAG